MAVAKCLKDGFGVLRLGLASACKMAALPVSCHNLNKSHITSFSVFPDGSKTLGNGGLVLQQQLFCQRIIDAGSVLKLKLCARCCVLLLVEYQNSSEKEVMTLEMKTTVAGVQLTWHQPAWLGLRHSAQFLALKEKLKTWPPPFAVC